MAPGGTNSKNNVLPLWGNEKTMNLNNLILTNIQSSHYFKVNLFELKSYHGVIDEIYYKVAHLEPWEKGSRKTAGQTGMCGGVRGVGAGGIVSTAFCLLYKLFTLKLTRKQVNGLITHSDSPYIRALGFMYIRYTQPPADLWDWYEPYLDDEEVPCTFSDVIVLPQIESLESVSCICRRSRTCPYCISRGKCGRRSEMDVKAGGGCVMTIGEMLRHYLTKLEWYSTLFPRIPVPIQKDLERKLSQHGPFLKETLHKDGPNGPVAGGGLAGPGGPGNAYHESAPAAHGLSSADSKERHIPDEEVSWGEAERISRLRRSVSREKKTKEGSGGHGSEGRSDDRKERSSGRQQDDDHNRGKRKEYDRDREERRGHHHHHHHHGDKDRYHVDRSRSSSRDRRQSRDHEKSSREGHRERRPRRSRSRSCDRYHEK